MSDSATDHNTGGPRLNQSLFSDHSKFTTALKKSHLRAVFHTYDHSGITGSKFRGSATGMDLGRLQCLRLAETLLAKLSFHLLPDFFQERAHKLPFFLATRMSGGPGSKTLLVAGCPSSHEKMPLPGSPVRKATMHRYISTKVLLAEGRETPFSDHCRDYENMYRVRMAGPGKARVPLDGCSPPSLNDRHKKGCKTSHPNLTINRGLRGSITVVKSRTACIKSEEKYGSSPQFTAACLAKLPQC